MKIIVLLLAFTAVPTYGLIQLGGTMSQTTDGRPVPGAYLGVRTSSILVNSYSTGVQTTLYYQSGYMLSVQNSFSIGAFAWGALSAGIGGGAYYSDRGYRATETSDIKKSQDINGGPAFHITWQAAGPFFITIQSILGLRNPLLMVMLRSQDMTCIVAGFEL